MDLNAPFLGGFDTVAWALLLTGFLSMGAAWRAYLRRASATA